MTETMNLQNKLGNIGQLNELTDLSHKTISREKNSDGLL